MGKLHELLAVEKTKTAGAEKLVQDTLNKFGKFEYFQGHVKRLKMLEATPANEALEAAYKDDRVVPTTVEETLTYALNYWAEAEDVIFQKNVTNQRAIADIVFRDKVLVKDVPVDELMGLEVRLEKLRRVLDLMPTLPAAVDFKEDTTSGRPGLYAATQPEVATKTEKKTVPVVLYEATKEHPAQVKEVSQDIVVGTVTKYNFCGAATSQQKADAIRITDELVTAVKQARMRANSVDASTAKIGGVLVDTILSAFK